MSDRFAALAAVSMSALFALAACGSAEEQELIVITNTSTTLELIGKTHDAITLRVNLRFDGSGIIGTVEDTRGVSGAIALEGDTTPLGTIDGGSERLELRADAMLLGGTQFMSTENLDRALEASTQVGAMLRRLLPLHARVRALLPETRGFFRVAAHADPTATDDIATWPTRVDLRDRTPEGRLAGDIADVGMTCRTGIFCPSHAPVCSDVYNFCTRACLDDADCGGTAHCLAATSATKFCFFECGAAGGTCPALLMCTGLSSRDDQPTICAGAME